MNPNRTPWIDNEARSRQKTPIYDDLPIIDIRIAFLTPNGKELYHKYQLSKKKPVSIRDFALAVKSAERAFKVTIDKDEDIEEEVYG